MRRVRDEGFEVGIHCWDHVNWQDGVANADAEWTARELRSRRASASPKIFETPPKTHGAAGWQMNVHALRLTQPLGFDYCSDGRNPPFCVSRSACTFICQPAAPCVGGGVLKISVKRSHARCISRAVHVGVGGRDAVLPVHVIPAVHADLEAVVAHRAHVIGGAPADVGARQQRAVQQRAPAVVLDAPTCAAPCRESRGGTRAGSRARCDRGRR